MFGLVTAHWKELDQAQQDRYSAVYCGVCRQIRQRSSQLSRLGLRYDMAFLAMLLMSLYEPEETGGNRACILHPVRKRPWVENEYICYAADMNVALAYFKAADDWADDHRLTARWMMGIFGRDYPGIQRRWKRQCDAIAQCIEQLSGLEKAGCPNPDEPANCFGRLMGELLVYQEDLWAPTLRRMGMALGRFIYLADAAADFDRDLKQGKYNPYIAMGMEKADWPRWEEYLVLAMGRCTEEFEKLPLVQDKAILDNILYSGVWLNMGRTRNNEQEEGT